MLGGNLLSYQGESELKRKLLFLLMFILCLTGCMDKEIGQAVIGTAPIMFCVSIGFQYLFFCLWKRTWPDLIISLRPNIIFLLTLVFLAFLFSITLQNGTIILYALVYFGTSYLTVFFLVLRIWLFFNHTNAFTWASIATMLVYILPAFPMIAGITEGTSFSEIAILLWMLPGSLFLKNYPGVITAIVFMILLIEAWQRNNVEG